MLVGSWFIKLVICRRHSPFERVALAFTRLCYDSIMCLVEQKVGCHVMQGWLQPYVKILLCYAHKIINCFCNH